MTSLYYSRNSVSVREHSFRCNITLHYKLLILRKFYDFKGGTSPAGWLPKTRISPGTLRSVIEYGLPLPLILRTLCTRIAVFLRLSGCELQAAIQCGATTSPTTTVAIRRASWCTAEWGTSSTMTAVDRLQPPTSANLVTTLYTLHSPLINMFVFV